MATFPPQPLMSAAPTKEAMVAAPTRSPAGGNFAWTSKRAAAGELLLQLGSDARCDIMNVRLCVCFFWPFLAEVCRGIYFASVYNYIYIYIIPICVYIWFYKTETYLASGRTLDCTSQRAAGFIEICEAISVI